MEELKTLLIALAAFLVAYFAPVGDPRVQTAALESLYVVQEYARQHVLFCLVPAFFIAGAMQNSISTKSVMRYLGQGAKQWLAYAVASVSGAILAVCSCTVLPLFMGIYKKGAGLGPAAASLYSGPALNLPRLKSRDSCFIDRCRCWSYTVSTGVTSGSSCRTN